MYHVVFRYMIPFLGWRERTAIIAESEIKAVTRKRSLFLKQVVATRIDDDNQRSIRETRAIKGNG